MISLAIYVLGAAYLAFVGTAFVQSAIAEEWWLMIGESAGWIGIALNVIGYYNRHRVSWDAVLEIFD